VRKRSLGRQQLPPLLHFRLRYPDRYSPLALFLDTYVDERRI
jgi:hypothetical protein